MNNKILKIFLKVLWLTIVIILFYQVWKLLINEFNWKKTNNISSEKNTNDLNFKNISTSEISKSAIALWTNIWIKHWQEKEKTWDFSKFTIYDDIFSIEELLQNRKKAKEVLISKNMFATKEYFLLLKTDFRSLLENSQSRKNTLDSIISQLKLRYNYSVNSVKNLEAQKAILLNEIEKINQKTEAIKREISKNFSEAKQEAVNENINSYLAIKNDYIYLRTYTVFVNNFLRYYLLLNDQNLKLLKALSLNRDAIEKWSYVVLPNSWKEVLREYWLLYTEEEFKILQKLQEKED